MKMTKLAALAFLTAIGTAASADMQIADIRAFETAPTAMAGGGFMQITNTGTTDDRLVAVEADFPRVELHSHDFDSEGIARMIHLEDGIAVPAGETVTLEPGGLHVMFMGLRGSPLVAGETVDATLIFEEAGPVPVTFDIVKRDMQHGHGHSEGHNH
ncbi:copper chaperone PCu(A)C [Cognatiyoonia sp. IB215446]|uniref:copper chaperone PCu(A)C n=1 Tax=Cognatiyoonia sp. IB215446 TaxID=3097355 RepID=UPI002A104D56|nr:copper chaperone PCu(A)C [Cognatiyoonia sp. IB215446]MDX8348868.1 copper chaperone PCu(A)C [Cognatiyoonia sp. IB215446]